MSLAKAIYSNFKIVFSVIGLVAISFSGVAANAQPLIGVGTGFGIISATTIVIDDINDLINYVGDSTCTPSGSVILGDLYDCQFPLTGSTTNEYYIPPTSTVSGLTEQNGNVSGDSLRCDVINNVSPNAALLCEDMPTDGNLTTGDANPSLKINGSNPVDKGDIRLIDGNGAACGTNPDPTQELYRSCAIIYKEKEQIFEYSFNISRQNPPKFKTEDLTITIHGSSQAGANGKTQMPELVDDSNAICRFRVKGTRVAASDNNYGYNAMAGKLRSANAGSTLSKFLEASTDTAESIQVPYSPTNGCSLTLPSNLQDLALWEYELKVVDGDGVIYHGNNSYFMKFGAIGSVAVTGVPIS